MSLGQKTAREIFFMPLDATPSAEFHLCAFFAYCDSLLSSCFQIGALACKIITFLITILCEIKLRLSSKCVISVRRIGMFSSFQVFSFSLSLPNCAIRDIERDSLRPDTSALSSTSRNFVPEYFRSLVELERPCRGYRNAHGCFLFKATMVARTARA